MTLQPTSTWSESLQPQTREAIEEIAVTPDGHLHFKHPTMGYAYTTIDDLVHERRILHSRKGSGDYRFAEMDAVREAGWGVD